MARARAEHPSREALLAMVDEQGRLTLRVTPGARMEALEIAGGSLLAKVRARPENGKATEAVRNLLADALELAPSRVELLRSATSREKQFKIER